MSDQVFESNDLTEAQAATSTKDFQTASEELPTSQTDEYQCCHMGPTTEEVIALHSEQSGTLRESPLCRSVVLRFIKKYI